MLSGLKASPNVRKTVSFVLLVVLTFSFAVSKADEGEATEQVDEDLLELIQRIGLNLESIHEAMRGTILTVRQYKAIQNGTTKLIELDPTVQEFTSLDPMFEGDVTAVEFLAFLLDFGADSTNSQRQSEATSSEVRDVDEITVYAYSFNRMPLDVSEFRVADIHYLRSIRGRANELYRDGEYKKAYPLLLGLAKRGFRDSQSRLAYILLNGADGVPRSNLRALGWLGAASAAPTEPRFKVLFKRYMRQVPDHTRATVDEVVAKYRREYSHSDYWVCSTEHPYAVNFQSSIVKRIHCRFRLEATAHACGLGRCWADGVKNSDDSTYIFGFERLERRLEERLNSRVTAIMDRGPG